MHELDAGDAGAYDDEVFWYLLGWVSVAGGEDTFMVDWCPFWDTRPTSGRENDSVRC